MAVLVVSGGGLLGYYALGLPPIGLALPVGAALYSATEAGRLWWAVGAGAALVTVSSLARSLGGEDPGYLYGYELPTTVAVMAAAILLGEVVRSRRLWLAEVAGRAAREAERQVQHERLALARDLHDVLAHTMSVVTLHADVTAEAIEDGNTEAARTAVERVREASGGAARELRGTVGALRAGPVGSLSRLDELIGGRPVEVTVEGRERPLPQVVDATAYRIVQEALTNAQRHAPGRPVRLTLAYHPAELGIRIVNAGATGSGPGPRGHRVANAGATGSGPGPAGHRVENGDGHGLRGMRERAALLGGELTVGPAPDGSFVVTARLPAESASPSLGRPVR